jgi:hypothetical protein
MSYQHARPFDEWPYYIDLNCNDPADKANAFLMKDCHQLGRYHERCIGGADLAQVGEHAGKWRVTVEQPLDVETDSDARLLGYYDTQAQALAALWAERSCIHW